MVIVHTVGLKALGFYSEFEGDVGSDRSIKVDVRPSPSPYEQDLIHYLSEGYVLLDVMESCRDVIEGDFVLNGGSSLVTDGDWIWRLDLGHYVSKYHLALPQEFVEFVVSNEFRIPILSEASLTSLAQQALIMFGYK